ncbi:MAG: hypothetical protein ACRDP6_32415 [Actinoallomurus sp.]
MLDQHGLRLIAITERALPILEELERQDVDPGTLQRYLQIDAFLAQLRALAREQRVLADITEGEPGGQDTALLVVIRWAASAVEKYERVTIGEVPGVSVAAAASDDVASLLGALIRNATQYSSSPVRVSARPIHDGDVSIRIDDDGWRFDPGEAEQWTLMLSRPVLPVNEWASKHSGLPVVHRAARRHGIVVQLVDRQPFGNSAAGTTAMVTLPSWILRPARTAPRIPGGGPPGAVEPPLTPEDRPETVSATAHREPPTQEPARTTSGLPVRQPGSLLGPRPSRASRRTPEDRVQGVREFGEDLTAFTHGDVTEHARPSGANDHGSRTDDAR